ALTASTPVRTTIKPPYSLTTGVVTSNELSQIAETRCREMQEPFVNLPPHPFTTDGCSLWPDSTWRACCIEHDFAYWCGGTTEQRLNADRTLRACVAEHSNAFNAWLMFLGVRVGGMRLQPWPWRWGYGYDWPYRIPESEKNNRN
ncbi:MAG TPA: hypothetical protein VET48_02000, partial [Steroidobacteraceae bacterium]|nr:hypothetical protein [Steroidobacteraceae bacterium]